jgi:hypothetical protein
VTTLELQDKPSNATYSAKVKVLPHGEIRLVPGETSESWCGGVEVAWYADGLKLTIPGAAPAAITQAYLTGRGRDVIIEIKPVPNEDEALPSEDDLLKALADLA